MEISELRPQQRAGLIVWRLARGDKLRTADAARLVGLSWDGTWIMLCMLSAMLPICQNENLEWRMLDTDEITNTQ